MEPEPGVLYLVGTPIGNLGDLSPRAISILKKVSVIACEDTRHSGKLIKKFNSKARLLSFYKHNINNRIPQLLSLLKEEKAIALISDAGLPGISDPGEELVSAAKRKGYNVVCIPGPCAATTALVISGLPTERFCFEGFLPTKNKERKFILSKIAEETRTTIIYEAPHKLKQLLKELNESCGSDRPLEISRELTKIHEQTIGRTINDAIEYFSKNQPQGEFTLILGGHLEEKKELTPIDKTVLQSKMMNLIKEGASANEASKILSESSGISRRILYNILHEKID